MPGGCIIKLGMGDSEVGGKLTRMVFVTVGTTSFDALVRAVDTEQVKQILYARGYTHLLIQMGRGTYNPTKVMSVCHLVCCSIGSKCNLRFIYDVQTIFNIFIFFLMKV